MNKIGPDIQGGWMREIDWVKVGPLRTAVVKITPAMAKQMLLGNVLNRSLRHYSVERYARDMASERWTLTGSPLIFDSGGELIDGQHRLYACIEGGGPFKTLVCVDVETATRLKVDTNIARKHPDMLKLVGAKNVTMTAGTLSHVWRWLNGDIDTRKAVVSFSELQAVLDKHAARLACSIDLFANSMRLTVGRWGGPSVHAMLHFLFGHVSRESADEFYRLLDTGDNLTAASPIHRLRNLMVRAYSGQRTTRRTPTETMAVVIKTWNAWRAKTEVEHLHWRKSDRVPEIDGLPKTMQRAAGRGIEVEEAVL